ncbi:uncharacterized protein LOC115620968 [Scaptodrosophila lebanonensis]|uniref:Uncharacterized protein LOC115620968 n=1 Tax=Drosophila lebanonensis TaxID=7225 RepID=A0A6J2T5F3_DROLE|nr:uncharacterized protein LOC115620968 [Scaptodrosophila lebanonensis]
MNLVRFLVLSVSVISPSLGLENFTVIQFLRDIRYQQHFGYLMLLKNMNATISTNFTRMEDNSHFVKDIMDQIGVPLIQLNERVSFYLKNNHRTDLLTMVYLSSMNLMDHDGLLKALVGDLRHMTSSRVLFLVELEKEDYMFLFKLFELCWRQQLLNVVAMFADHQATGTFYSYTHFPAFRLEQRLYNPNETIFPDRLRNMHGYRLPVIIGGTVPRIIAYYNKKGRIVFKGTVGHFMNAFQQKYNCTFVEPLPVKPGAPSTDLTKAVLNGTVDISMGITYPTIPFYGFTYPYEILNWCLMLPVEPNIPAAQYYINVFELDAFLLTVGTMVVISTVLSATLLFFGYGVHIYEFFLHDSCLRGALGQSFSEVFHPPTLVRGIYIQICVLGILLTVWFNSYFSAYVTSMPKTAPYRTFDDVLESNLKVVAWKPEYDELLGRLVEFRKYKPMFKVESNFSRYISDRDSFNTKYGYMMTSSKWIVVTEQQKIFTSVLFRMRDDFCFFNTVPLGFPVHENSIYMEPINTVILEMSAHGLHTYALRMGFTEQIEAGQLSLKDLSPRREYRAMQVEDLVYIWYGFAFMVLLSGLVLLLEILWQRLGGKNK